MVLGIESSLEGMGFANSNAAQAIDFEVRRSQLELDSLRSRLRQNFFTLRSDIQLSEQIVKSINQTVVQLAKTLKSYKRQFDAGRKSWLEVLNMQRELSQQQQLSIQTKGQFIKQNVELISIANKIQQLKN